MKISGFEEFVNDMNNGTFDFTENGKCIGCGNCCSNILPINDGEIKRIKRYIKTHNIKECKHNIPFSEEVLDLLCPFLDNGKSCDKCTIYEVRPMICREFSCCPANRKQIDIKRKMNCRTVDVRSEFFNK